MAKQVMIVKPNTLNAKDKDKLTKAGYVVVEHEFPQDVRIVTAIDGANMNLALKSFAEGIIKSNWAGTYEKVGKAIAENALASIIGQ